MIIHYCDKCGNRVPKSQIDSGAVVVTDEIHAVCAGCAGKRHSRRASQLKITPSGTEQLKRKSERRAVASGKRSGIQAVSSSGIVPAHRKAPSSGHLAHPFPDGDASQDTPKRKLIYIGGGIVVVLVGVAIVLLSGGSNEKPVAEKKTSSKVAAVPAPVAAGPAPTTPTVKPTPAVSPPVSSKPQDEYDPRAAVAASALAEAKAKAKADPWAYRDLLKNVKTRYVRTPAAEEAQQLLTDWKAPPQVTPPGQDKPRLDGSGDTFLTLADAYAWKCGHDGRARANTSIQDKPLRIGNRSFDQGIGLHAKAELNYDLGGHYRWVSGYLGIDKETGSRGSVRFEVWLDGRKALETPVLRGNSEAHFFKVPVESVRQLRIVASDGGDGSRWDHADVCRLRVSIGTDEPKDDYSGGTTEVAKPVVPTPPAPKPEPKPAKPKLPVVSEAVRARQAYAQFLTGLWGTLGERGWTVARTRLAGARKNPRLATFDKELDADSTLVTLTEKAWAAIPEGAAKLKDHRAFKLVERGGRTYELGPGGKARVLQVADATIEVEWNEGRGGKLILKVALERLTFACKRDLAQIGLPTDGEGQLSLLLMNWLQPDERKAEGAEARTLEALAKAEAAKAPPDSVARLRAWMDIAAKERAAQKAASELERLIAQRKGPEALAAFEALKKEHLETACWAQLKPTLPDIEERLLPLRLAPKLWVSYWSGDNSNRFKTFHLARVEGKLVRNMGGGSGDPSMPKDDFGIRFGGYLKIPAAGRYAFYSKSDDGLKVWLDGKRVTKTMCSAEEVEVDLKEGLHAFKAEFYEIRGGATMIFRWRPPGATDWQDIPIDLLSHRPDEAELYQKP